MNPELLLGMKYRLGSNPVDHGTADCLSLARTVLSWYGIPTPTPQRSWYRRLRQKRLRGIQRRTGALGNKSNWLRLWCSGFVQDR